MARVTTEDCIDKVPNRFELVMLAAYRARELSSGMEPTVERENDKNPVIALREIAEETQPADEIRERSISFHQKQNEVDEPEEDQLPLPIHMESIEESMPVFLDEPVDDIDEEAMLRQMINERRGTENYPG